MTRKATFIAWSVPLILKLIIHILACCKLGLHRDEFLYLALGKHLDWGYVSNPPFIGLVSWLAQILPSNEIITIRLLPMLAGVALVYVAMLICKELGGGVYAQFLTGIATVFAPAYLRTSNMLMPVIFDFLFWAILLLLVVRYINHQKDSYLYFFGIVLGICMLNKLLVLFFLFALLISLMISKYRPIFLKSSFFASIIICVVIASPYLIWQIQQNFPALEHMQVLSETQLVNISLNQFLSDQLLMLFIGSLLWIIGLIGFFTVSKLKPYKLFAIGYLLFIFILIYFDAKSYYTVGYYVVLLASGAVAIENWIKINWIRYGIVFIIVALSIPILPLSIPILSPENTVKYFDQIEKDYGIKGARRWENGREYPLPQDYADMLGWEELVFHTSKAYAEIDDPSTAFLYAENYGQAGAIEFYGKKYGLPTCFSFSDTFRKWIPDEIPEDLKSMVYINDEIGEDIQSLFEKITAIGTISHPLSRERGTTVYLCENPNASFFEFLNARFEQIRIRNFN